MNKYTAEFVEAEVEVAMSQGKHGTAAMFREFAALLRERESAKAEVTDETRGTYACPICGKEYPHYHPEDTSRVNWHSDYRKVFEDIISANVRLYKDGVSIAPTNYSHESKLTVAGIAGHWFAYGAEDARSFGRESKGTDSAAWSEFASNGDGYAYAWMDSLWSLFKQTVVALKGREAVAPMLASQNQEPMHNDPRAESGDAEEIAQWLYANGYHVAAYTIRTQLDIRNKMLASARIPDGWRVIMQEKPAGATHYMVQPRWELGQLKVDIRWFQLWKNGIYAEWCTDCDNEYPDFRPLGIPNLSPILLAAAPKPETEE